jgi:hypothetical protein
MNKSPSDIFGKLNSKLSQSIRARYADPRMSGIKLHSVFTVGAIFLTEILLIFFKSMNYQNDYLRIFIMIYKAAYIVVLIWLYIYTFYCWRVYFRLREEGSSRDKNIFFSESAGLYRKVIFYVALVPWFISSFRSQFYPEDTSEMMNRLRYQLRADYYRAAGTTILESIMHAILLVELSRFIFPKTLSWSDKRHTTMVVVVSAIISTLRVAALNSASGHGII